MKMRLRLSGLLLAVALAAAAAALAAARNTSNERGPSPEHFGLRPDPESSYEFPRLQEPEGKQYDPRPRDLNTTALLARLGKHFDPRYMSIHKPRNHTQSHVDFPFRHQRGGKHGGGRLVPVPGADMPQFLRRMNFRTVRLPNGTRLRTHVSPRLQKKLQHFLWAWTACPVVHTWRDMGVRYWPRYLMEGRCNSGHGSCSVPPGMKCAPSNRETKVIRRWRRRGLALPVDGDQQLPHRHRLLVRVPVAERQLGRPPARRRPSLSQRNPPLLARTPVASGATAT